MRARIPTIIVTGMAVSVLGAGAVAQSKGGPGHHGPSHGASPSHRHGQGHGAQDQRALFAVLSGRNELDANGRKGAGDPDGFGSFSATIDGTKLCFGITVGNLDAPVAAHIHQGKRNVNGPIVVPLTQPASGDPGASSGCVDVTAELAAAILTHPRQYYANVHTTAFQAGAIRGQLFRRAH